MRQLSIKARVTLWYTAFMMVFMCFALFSLLYLSGRMSQTRIRQTLTDVVTDTVNSVELRYGHLDFEDMDFYRNGVSIFLYDTSGYLLAPKINLGVQADSTLQDQIIRVVQVNGEKQMIYDVYAVQGNQAFWVRGIASMAEAGMAYSSFRFLCLVGMPAFLVLTALGGFMVTKRAFLPVSQMAETAGQISSGTDLTRRIETGSKKDELSRLALAMNRMLERLQASFNRERQFTSDVSHELRTPLSVIRSQCEYALSPEADCGQKEEALASILRQTRRMTDMVSQLLLLSRAENGTFQPDMADLDLSQTARMAAMDLMPAAEAAGLTLTEETEPGIHAVCDETLIIRMISNLLTNAIRYNRPDGSICLSLKKEGGFAVLKVSDTGIGIQSGDLERIWDRFYRADPSRSSEGSGLGLSMVRWIARLHGGEAQAESIYGTGSVFTVRIPLETNRAPLECV